MKKTPTNITRRKIIKSGVQSFIALPVLQFVPGISGNTQNVNDFQVRTYHGCCYHDCPDTCSWDVTVENGAITDFKANSSNPFTGDQLCNKMETFPEDITFHPERVLTPLKRVGEKGKGAFERVSWDQALSEIAENLKAIIELHGSEAVLPFGYAGTQGLVQGGGMSERFFAKLGSSRLGKTMCGSTAVTGHMLTNGGVMGILPEDIVHSRFIILWGTDTKKSNVHLWPYIMEARKRGAHLVVVDPFRTKTAQEADQHIALLPGTDVALALGMMNVIISENLVDQEYIDQYTFGYEALKTHVEQYSPSRVSKICGLEEKVIEELARAYAGGSPSCIRFLIGMEHNYNGGDGFRAIAMLPSLTGAWRKLGGGLLHMTFEFFGEALNWERINMHESLWEKETRFINMVQLATVLNDQDLNPAIKALFVYNSNPGATNPNQNMVRKGLGREDLLTVVLDHFITDTAMFADYILPATTQLEHWDVGDSWGQVYININEPTIAPRGETKPNSEIFRLLASAMGYKDECFKETDLEIAKSVFKTKSPLMKGITFNYLKKHGWARFKIPEPFLPHERGNFNTESGKCEFYTSALESQGQALPEYKEVEGDKNRFPLMLLTIKGTQQFHNSSHANVKHLIKKEGPFSIFIHEEDARKRNLQSGEEAVAENQYGSITLNVKISDKVRPGLVMIPQGYWAKLVKGGSSANVLTSDRLADHGGGGAMQDCRVEVRKA